MSFAEDESPEIPEQEAQRKPKSGRWYAVQVASGCEKRVKANLEQRIHTLDVADKVFQVQIPHTPTVKIRK
ncbi:MAG: transcription termination/antitermination NusG family protein, partial [Spirulinaceae cyanobacterium]